MYQNNLKPQPGQYSSSIYFQLEHSDLLLDGFHRVISREAIEDELTGAEPGTYAIRPSSVPGCYALSSVFPDGQVKHDLIYNFFPGFSLFGEPTIDQIFPTLKHLVANTPRLTTPLQAPSPSEQPPPQGAEEIFARIKQSLEDKEESLCTTLEWELRLQDKQGLLQADECEHRTLVHFSTEKFQAPAFFLISENEAKGLEGALTENTNLLALKLTGHDGGLSRIKPQPLLGDIEAIPILQCLKSNTTLTMLDLSYNLLTDETAKRLATILATPGNALTKVLLLGNMITQSGLFALTTALSDNSTINEFKVANQLRKTETGYEFISEDRHKNLVKMIHDSFQRKREFTQPFFCGFRWESEAQLLLTSFAQGQPNSTCYLFYVNRVTGHMTLCYTSAQQKAVHKSFYRIRTGYTFTAPPTEVPRLTKLCALQIDKELSHIDSGTKICIQEALNLDHFWRIASFPDDELEAEMLFDADCSNSCFSTLSHLVIKYKPLARDSLAYRKT